MRLWLHAGQFVPGLWYCIVRLPPSFPPHPESASPNNKLAAYQCRIIVLQLCGNRFTHAGGKAWTEHHSCGGCNYDATVDSLAHAHIVVSLQPA